MIIVGDIASPDPKCSADLLRFFREYQELFASDSLVCNLEGMLCDDILPNTNTPVLFNHSSVLSALIAANTKVAALANNHTLDLPEYFDNTLSLLSNAGIAWCGAGRTQSEAERAIGYMDRGVEVVVFNFCWDFLLYHQRNPTQGVYVGEINNLSLIQQVKRLRESKPDTRILVYLHWSIDLETLPYPMYRKLSMELVDVGANVVIGTHSHCTQGGEKYKDGYIIYGLGNFFLPHNTFANGKLTFPDFSRLEMAFQWDPVTKNGFCHWFKYCNEDGRHSLLLQESAPFEESKLLEAHSPYTQSFDEYLIYFKKHRRKRFLMPIYKEPRAVWRNAILTQLLKLRGRTARSMAKLKIIKWQS